MHPWRPRLLAALLSLPSLFLGGPPAQAQVSVQIGVQIGSYPRLVRVPGYPVYYSPGAPANLFFYDGVYWLYVDDGWYTSSWYNGPWSWVDPFAVPVYVLRVPVRYYPLPPPYFRPWRAEAPPRWGEHWGADWQRRNPGWDHWDHRKAPPPAPLPVYQRAYGGERYPSPDEQRRLQQQQYRYHPREPVARAHLAAPGQPQPPSPQGQPPSQRPQPVVPPQQAQRPAPVPATQERPPERSREREQERMRERPQERRPDRPQPQQPPEPRVQQPAPQQRPGPSMQPPPAPAMPRAEVEHRREAQPQPQRPAMPSPAAPPREMGGPREAPHGGGGGGGGGGGPGPDRGRDHPREERGRDR